jgi:flagellar biosynthesis/type III secretory pathway protein FliH
MMLPTITMHLEKPIASVNLIGGAGEGSAVPSGEDEAAELQQTLKEDLAQVRKALQDAVTQINNFQKNMVESNKEQIAKLSVEIARKILMQKVQEGDYEIESIVKEALEHAPTRKDVVVRLNPQDLVECQKAQQDDSGGTFTGVEFVADTNIGRAECMVESPKGVIKSLIEEHLERIAKAFEKAE